MVLWLPLIIMLRDQHTVALQTAYAGNPMTEAKVKKLLLRNLLVIQTYTGKVVDTYVGCNQKQEINTL